MRRWSARAGSSAAEHHERGGAATATAAEPHAGHSDVHGGFQGVVDHAANGFDPHLILRDFDEGTTTRLASGRVLRSFELVAQSTTSRSRPA